MHEISIIAMLPLQKKLKKLINNSYDKNSFSQDINERNLLPAISERRRIR